MKFRYAKLGRGRISFYLAQFEQTKIMFGYNKFYCSEVNFIGLNLGRSEMYFENVDFLEGDLSFQMSEDELSEVKFYRCKFGHSDFRFKKLHKLEIIDCIIEGILQMDSTEEYRVFVNSLSIDNTKNRGSIVGEGCTFINGISENKNSNFSKANQMKMLKENFHNIGEYDLEDETYVEYKRYIRKKLKEDRKIVKTWKEKSNINKKICFDYLVDLCGVYGTSPRRVAKCMLIVWLIFGIIFEIVNHLEVPWLNVSDSIQCFDGFYFSAITFLTIGYGDISPIGIVAKCLAPLEGFLGLFLMSFFTVAIVRKTLR